MGAQTSYTINTQVAYEGLLADLGNNEIVSKVAEDSGVSFGRAVSRGTADGQCVLGGAEFLGIAVRDLARMGAYDGAATVGYAETEAVSAIQRGRIYAKAPAGAVPGDQVKYNTTTGILGAGAAGGGEAVIPGATWESTVQAGKIGIIRLSGQVDAPTGS